MPIDTQWAAARSRAQELRCALQEGGFRPVGLKVAAAESWLRQRGTRNLNL